LKLSAFGEKFSARSGAVELMEDLGNAMLENPDAIMMGGGNPGQIPEIEDIFKERMQALIDNPKLRHQLLGKYQSPQGEKSFRQALSAFLKKKFGWAINEHNIGVSNGSQSAFFILYNLFAGKMNDGSHRSIHLPLSPEYLGYADTGLSENFFSATKPNIELLEQDQFKYRINFDDVHVDEKVAALCVSRPTNPTGNVLTDNEMAHLDDIAQKQQIPLIVDGAYGLPFPNIIFNDAKPNWNKNTILVLSLSKLGLPGIRTGIIVAREEVIQAYNNSNTVISLACGTLGPAITQPLFANEQISKMSDQFITPFYKSRAEQTVQWLRESLSGVSFRIHKPEGALFLWLWFEGMPISSHVLYQRLKARGVIVVPGHNFFVGIEEHWQHKHECIRVSYAGDVAQVKRGVEIIAQEAHLAFTQ